MSTIFYSSSVTFLLLILLINLGTYYLLRQFKNIRQYLSTYLLRITFEIIRRYLAWPFTILQNDNITISWDFFRLTAPKCHGMAAGAVSLRKSHDIIILWFCNIVKGQAIYQVLSYPKYFIDLCWDNPFIHVLVYKFSSLFFNSLVLILHCEQ